MRSPDRPPAPGFPWPAMRMVLPGGVFAGTVTVTSLVFGEPPRPRQFGHTCPPLPPAQLNRRLWEREGIIGGLDLGRFDLGLEGCWLLTATELNSRSAIDRLVQAVAS